MHVEQIRVSHVFDQLCSHALRRILIYFCLSSSMNFGSIASLLSVVDDGSKSKSLFRNGFQLPPIISIIVSGKYETHIAKKLIMCYATYIAVRGV